MRLIDADALFEFIQGQMEKETGAYTKGKNKAFNIVKSALHNECATPTIDAEPVKRGRWIDRMVRDWHCSECGKKLTGHGWDGYCYKDLPLYCPSCGARMDGE